MTGADVLVPPPPLQQPSTDEDAGLGITSVEMWPTIAESHASPSYPMPKNVGSSTWEVVSAVPSVLSNGGSSWGCGQDDDADYAEAAAVVNSTNNSPEKDAVVVLPQSVSMPDFGQFEVCSSSSSSAARGNKLEVPAEGEEGMSRSSSFTSCEHVNTVVSSLADASSSMVMVESPSSPWATADKGVKRVPSFKDVILLAQASNSDADNSDKQADEAATPTRTTPKLRPKLVVQEFKRCAKSAGDLRSLAIMEERCGVVSGQRRRRRERLILDDEEEYAGSGGGGFCSPSTNVVEEDDHRGACDGDEFYARKKHGSMSRKNGQKLRPDEAKRRDMIVHKKNMQRLKQKQSQGNQKQGKQGKQ